VNTYDALDGSTNSDQFSDDQDRAKALQDPTTDTGDQAGSAAVELAAALEKISALEGELAGVRTAHESAVAEASQLHEELNAARQQVREATMGYRRARLAAAPEVPPDMVPESNDILEIDRGLENAERLVNLVRESVQQESLATARQTRIPAGSPARRELDLSSLSAAEKIRIGLESLSEAGAR
jgi:hypothetical protein